MHHQTIFNKPSIVGCAPYAPAGHDLFIERGSRYWLDLDDPTCLQYAKDWDIKYVIYHTKEYESSILEFIENEKRLSLIRQEGEAYLFSISV